MPLGGEHSRDALLPQHTTPLLSTAQVCEPPAAMLIGSLFPLASDLSDRVAKEDYCGHRFVINVFL
jgi:hypothetical protein